MDKLQLVKIKDILGMNFFIPDYQRGYRWEPQQAKDLLNDINEFINKRKNDKEIYCLQPLVVKQLVVDDLNDIIEAKSKEDAKKVRKAILKGSWEIIDGQQRLTTIFIILMLLGEKEIYSIEYQTRKGDSNSNEENKKVGSKEFLSEILIKNIENQEENLKDENIDFYHMHNVGTAIKNWLENCNEEKKETLRNTLLNSIQFIWYETEDEEPINVFERLNIGKIPLTNAELIKALFLNRANYDIDNKETEQKRFKIASDWDKIEYALQNDEFWLFIHEKEYSNPTRIDFILDYIFQENRLNIKNFNKKDFGNDEFKTFRYFIKAFDEKSLDENIVEWIEQTAWPEIKRVYNIFNEWYHDYKFYHYIGFLTSEGKNKSIYKYLNNWNDEKVKNDKEQKTDKNYFTKEDFVEKYLKNEIKSEVQKIINEFGEKLTFEDFVFDEEIKVVEKGEEKPKTISKTKCRPILLLHNIETIIQQNEKLVEESKYNLPNFSKFPFHLYKSEKWDIEHISSASGDNFRQEKDREDYLKLAVPYLSKEEHKDLINDINKYLKGESNDFDSLLEKILMSTGSISDGLNKIWNFTLLDSSTNREYKNSIFPVKRAYIANKEKGYKTKKDDKNMLVPDVNSKEVAFIPPCTKNVFTKFYTPIPTSLTNWTETDAKKYLEDIEEKLNDYLKEDETHD